MKYRRAVFIVTYKKEKAGISYLLLKRRLHWKGWEFPKGGVEGKEELKETAKREVKEETGNIAQNVKEYRINGKYRYKKKYPDRRGLIGQTYRLFSAEIDGKKVNVSRKEHSSYKWLDFEKAVKSLRWPDQKKCLRYVHRKLIKEH